MSKRIQDRAVQIRFPAQVFEALEDIRRARPKIPTLGATVRHLVDLGLQVEMTKKQSATTDHAT